MRILVTGREGQLAQSLAERAGNEVELIFAGRPGFDLGDTTTITRTINEIRPDLVINAAAYTAVDKAEDEPELALALNGDGPAFLAAEAARIGVPIIQVSTDYVFDGSAERPYLEEDQVCPIGAYGKSKLGGELAVQSSGAEYLILRTAWVYSAYGHNFVKTMLRLAETQEEVRVVDDQLGNPTAASDIADALLLIARRWQSGDRSGANQVYHFAGSGDTNWADFAREIFRASAALGGPAAAVKGISTAEWPTKARRPQNSRLNCSKFKAQFGHVAPDWQSSLNAVVRRLRS